MQRLLLLDGLRGIAAIGVVLFHCVIAFDALGAFARGYLFVDLFFLLSGFVLTLNYEQRMNAGAVRPGKFLRSRLVRLWPTVAAGARVAAELAPFGLLHLAYYHWGIPKCGKPTRLNGVDL